MRERRTHAMQAGRLPRALRARARAIHRIARAHGVSRVQVFGSQVRGEAKRSSDVDLLVDLEKERDLLDLAAFQRELEELLRCKVDVVTREGLSPYLRERILEEAVAL